MSRPTSRVFAFTRDHQHSTRRSARTPNQSPHRDPYPTPRVHCATNPPHAPPGALQQPLAITPRPHQHPHRCPPRTNRDHPATNDQHIASTPQTTPNWPSPLDAHQRTCIPSMHTNSRLHPRTHQPAFTPIHTPTCTPPPMHHPHPASTSTHKGDAHTNSTPHNRFTTT